MACLTSCAPTSAPRLGQYCSTIIREACDSILVAFRCDVTPQQFAIATNTTAAMCASLNTFFAPANNRIFRTGKLKNMVWGDPQFTAFTIDDCSPDRQIASTRELTFEDVNAIDVNPTTGAVSEGYKYFDYEFYKILSKENGWYFGHIDCNKNLYLHVANQTSLATSTNLNGITNQGNFVNAQVSVTVTKDRSVAKKCIETKKVSITYTGDPYNLVKPVFNLASCPVATYPNIGFLWNF